MMYDTKTLLDDGLMLDAASGAAPAAVRVLAACHRELNADAAQRLGSAEAAFGVLLETAPAASVSAGLLDRILVELDADGADAEPGDDPWPGMPRALHAALPEDPAPDWRPRFGGMSEIVLDKLCEPGVHARLLKLPSGGSAPEHTHGGDEITLVLAGSFRDEVSRYRAGEVCHAASGHMHQPVVDSDEDCICLVVEFGPLRPTNPVLALAGSVLGRIF